MSLSIIRQPFQQFHKIKELLLVKEVASKLPEGYQKQKEEEQPENQLFEYDVTKTAETLVKIMYITLFLLAISCLSSFTFNRFLDVQLPPMLDDPLPHNLHQLRLPHHQQEDHKIQRSPVDDLLRCEIDLVDPLRQQFMESCT